jgi:hypothetical protein
MGLHYGRLKPCLQILNHNGCGMAVVNTLARSEPTGLHSGRLWQCLQLFDHGLSEWQWQGNNYSCKKFNSTGLMDLYNKTFTPIINCVL